MTALKEGGNSQGIQRPRQIQIYWMAQLQRFGPLLVNSIVENNLSGRRSRLPGNADKANSAPTLK
jgi:hypothetical protein